MTQEVARSTTERKTPFTVCGRTRPGEAICEIWNADASAMKTGPPGAMYLLTGVMGNARVCSLVADLIRLQCLTLIHAVVMIHMRGGAVW